MNACSPAAVSARTGAGLGGGGVGFCGFGDPPIIARLSLTFEKSQAFFSIVDMESNAALHCARGKSQAIYAYL